MVVGINLIALYDEKSDGAFRYIHMLLQEMVNYDLYDTLFVIYKQQNISCDYLNLPSNLKIKYIDVPVLGRGIRRILFEQTVFYRYLVKCDVLYSYCLSMPLFMRCTKIFTLHDLYSYVDKERYGIIRRFYIRTMVKLYVKAANKIITVSEHSKKDIKEYLSVQDEKLSITYNFVNLKYDIQPEVIYTDSDIFIEKDCPIDFMSHFVSVLEKYPLCHKVGFGLRIDDIPNYFTMKEQVIKHESQFWTKQIEPDLYDARIDTTFALYRPFCKGPSNSYKFVIRTGGKLSLIHI